ncbi:LLM class flavin-dependent oxidoreductase [Ktedonosporobacter rubrisoli]|uniref:LLM class flavin-dependent oxidoreductase n=1 Tax=Ktedonosporobacter rubrisoli TaxID=2509675 RepID=A0A4P6JJX5_KTERU|nr:LLM class flavin-dependent oxidoreductase [Ktedonosporobacter rubrisoli]QBD75457.1 LLM class flavin-dependent oxidoreductase [Ktedonosporobacter rubrisoli]
MYYGIYVPNFGDETGVRALAALAHEAEQAGWDGFFLWDHILYRASPPVTMVDPWITLSAVAMLTERIRIGTVVTPLARRHPWQLARETVSLDHLSSGRLILGVGLGHPPRIEFAPFGQESDDLVRAEKLDEGLEVLTGLWKGEAFSYQGRRYRIKKTVFWPPALQQPRIPIWVAGFWPNKAPFRRAARWDGVVPLKRGGLQPDDVEQIKSYVRDHRTSAEPFDIVKIGITPGEHPARARRIVAPYAEVGATWWLESFFTRRNSLEEMRQRIRQGPPRA